MGGVVDGGAGIGIKTSPRRAAIEKAQAKLRQEYDVREERRRELEFLEKGGNPLDFKFGNAISISVQSTSQTDRHHEPFVSCEAKGSFALTASPHGDSFESSGRPGKSAPFEPNSADNLLLFDAENDLPEKEKKSVHNGRKNNNIVSKQSLHTDGNRNPKESEDSAIFRPYARRNRSRPNRDVARSSSTEIHGRGGHGSSVPSHPGLRCVKGSVVEMTNQKEQNAQKSKFSCTNGDTVPKTATSETHAIVESEQNLEFNAGLEQRGSPIQKQKMDATAKCSTDKQSNFHSDGNAQETLIHAIDGGNDLVKGDEEISSVTPAELTEAARIAENDSSNQLNGSDNLNRDDRCILNEFQNNSVECTMRELDKPSSNATPSVVDVKKDGITCTDTTNDDLNGFTGDKVLEPYRSQELADARIGEEQHKKIDGGGSSMENDHISLKNDANNGEVATVEDTDPQEGGKHCSISAKAESGDIAMMSESIQRDLVQSNSDVIGETPTIADETARTSGREHAAAPDLQSAGDSSKYRDKAYEDSVLEEARTITAKRKRIAELSGSAVVFENRRRSHWHYVLEEMAWLANDFAQERIWKMAAAAQLCHQIASKSHMRIQEQIKQSKSRKVACTLAKAVMQFWQSAKAVGDSGDNESFGAKVFQDGNADVMLEQKKESELKKRILPVQEYAVRFCKENNSPVPSFNAELSTSTIISDSDPPDILLEGHFTEESLFYTVPFGAMETYRKFIEAYVTQGNKAGSSIQEEANTSMFDVVGDSGYQGSACDEDDGETSTYHVPGTYDSIKPSKFSQKKRKNPMVNLPYVHTGIGTQPSIVIGKRHANLNTVPIPTKRIRSASRPRVIHPFNAGAGSGALSQVRTDASSGDTSSFQDDQSTAHGGSLVQKGVEVESAATFEKHLPFDYAETSAKPKKKKKIKYPGSTFEQSWQLDSAGPIEQRGQSKKRFENHQFEYDGSSGLYGLNATKKTKMMKHSLDNALDNILPTAGSVPSPAASQMSNPPNHKSMRYMGSRDRPKKAKMLKAPSAQPGSGSLWSQFEDQALVVLVHDMGPNWELVSDIMNDILQFKCIFRKARECKERHKFLMDKTNGDGADSAEDSGSSQSYPSTLPGIPKGSARQLFQRLQGPVEEDSIKGHFEKIIQIGQKQYQRKIQSENREQRQIATHSSHFVALSQVCANNASGVVFTPLELCEERSLESLSLGYPSSQASNLAMSNQGAVPSMFTPSNVNSSMLGPSGVALGNSLLPSSGPLNASMRDGRYNVQRAPPSPAEEQHRMHPYNQAMPNRPVQHANTGASSGTDRGAHMMPNGNSIGLGRSMPVARPGFPGIAASSALNSNNMMASGVVGMSGSMNIHTSSSSPQGGSMLRPREALHVVRPGHNSDQQRKMMLPDLPMQVTQGNAQGISQYNAGAPAFSNQTSPPVQMYPGHVQQPHQMPQQSHTMTHPHHPQLQGSSHPGGPQQQAFALRFAKERQLQQRYLQQHQPQHTLSNPAVPHLQPQAQLPMSSSLQGSPQVQPQPSSQPVLVSPLTPTSVATPATLQHQQKNQLPHQGLARSSQFSVSGSATPTVKQRQRQAQQQLQQSGRQHLQQRQQAQAQQHAKYLKGMGRGNMLVHQNLGVDPSHVNGLSLPPGSLGDKELQGPVLPSGTGISTVQSVKPLVSQSPNNLHLQQQLASGSPPHLPKQNQQVPSHSDKSTDSQFPPALGQTSSNSHQAIPSTLLASNLQELPVKQQTFQKQVNQTQPVAQRMLQQNRQMNYEPPMKSQPDQAQGDHKPVNNSSQIGTSTAMPNASDDSTNKTAINPSVHSQWKASETVHETSIPNTGNQVSTVGSPALINPSRSEPFSSSSQVLGQRHLSDGFNPQSQGVGGMGLQRQSQLKQSLGPTLSSQKHYQPQEQLVQLDAQSPQQSQQQTQHLQSGQGNMYVRPTNSKLE